MKASEEIAELKAIIKRLLQENAELRAENAELKELLKLNSENSSFPSSWDLKRKKRSLQTNKK